MICNNGTIRFKKEDTAEFIAVFNESGAARDLGEVKSSDISNSFAAGDKYVYLYVTERYGDLESGLRDLAKKAKDAGIYVDLEVSYYGNYEGTYLTDDGEFLSLSQDEMAVRNASTEALEQELLRRKNKGWRQEIHVNTPVGVLHAYESCDPDYPGICIDLKPAGKRYELSVVITEVTRTERDLEKEGPHLITRVWNDCSEEDPDRVVHTGYGEGKEE